MNAALDHAKLPLLASYDVLVVGAGSAGCCAAIAAREHGDFRVGLIERYGFFGGSSTGVLDTFYGFFTPGPTPKKVAGGVPDRVVAALSSLGPVVNRPNTYGAGTGVTYNPEHLKLVWDRLLSHAGVYPWLHTQLIDVETRSDGTIGGVVVATRAGIGRIAARRYIDCSGDADLCCHAGIGFELAGTIDPAQTLTTTFRMCNVDLAAYERAGGKKMLKERMQDADELPRKEGSAHAMTIENCIATVAVRVADVNATDPEQLTRAEIEGRRQAFVYEAFLRAHVPGYENARIIGLSHPIGVRETRRVYGEYRLTRDDCMSVARFDDRVLLCGAPIEDHAAGGQAETGWAYVPNHDAYDVPYRTLVPKGWDNVWVAGRCFSATHDAHASCRSMAQTMSMGQAAGLSATISLQRDCSARDIPIRHLQDRLRQLGALLEVPT
jgi:hypothetical protein